MLSPPRIRGGSCPSTVRRGGATGRIAELDPAQQTLLDEAKLTGLGEGRMHDRLTAASARDGAVLVDHALQGTYLVLNPASPFE
jgi:hypothetical protein